jgi:ribose/xylose/arabinose/galactoside ABC-type transport system permease subunit
MFIPITLILWFLLSRTVFGRYLYAAGSNARAAHFAAIRVRYIRLWVYVISGSLAGIAAVIKASRVASASPDAGLGTELQAITIAVLGGVNIMGGEGKIAGTFLSIAIITMIYNGLDLGGVHSIWQVGTLGMILIFSVLLNQFLIRRRGE